MVENFDIYSENEQKIDYILKNENDHVIHAMFIFNVDNLYEINQKFGMKVGDDILDKIEEKICSFFKGTDISAKIKDDEFIALIKRPKSITDIEKIAQKILKNIREINIDGFVVTVSVGISVYPFHGKSYLELREKAYQALKRVKSNGKNDYRLFDSALTKVGFSNFVFGGDYYDFDYRNLAEENWDRYFMDVSLQLFHYESNIYTCINSLLEIFCIYHGFNRSFIITSLEHTESDDRNMNFTIHGFEVENNSITQLIRQDLISRLNDEYHNYGYISNDYPSTDNEIMNYMSDMNDNEMLYFSLKWNDEFVGAAVLENAEVTKSKFQIQKLEKVYNQFNTFFSYALLSKNYRASKELLSKIEMFEGMGSNIFVIDSASYSIEYMNERAAINTGYTAIGKKCYSVIGNCNSPCEDCPINNMDINDSKANYRKDCFNHSSKCWSANMYSWVSGRDNKGKLLLNSIDFDNMFEALKK